MEKVRITKWDRPKRMVKDLKTKKESNKTFGQFIQEMCDDLDEKKVKYEIVTNFRDQIALFAWNKELGDQDKIKKVKAIRDRCPNCGKSDYDYVGVYSEFKQCNHCSGFRWKDDIERSISKEE